MLFDLANQYNKFLHKRIHFIEGEFYLFLHLPKTAGTSFRHILYRHTEQRDILPTRKQLNTELGGKYLLPLQLKQQYELATLHRHVHILCGHYAMHLQEEFSVRTRVLTFIREPLQRTVSHLKHIAASDPASKGKRLDQLWDENKEQLSNFQACRLGYFSQADNREAFLATIDSIYFIGLTEQFQQSLVRLNHLSGWQLKNINKKNTSSEQKTEVSDALAEDISTHLAVDYLLYKKVLEQYRNGVTGI